MSMHIPASSAEEAAVTLAALGFDSRVEALFAALEPEEARDHCIPGRVAPVDRGAATVYLEGALTRAELSTPLRHLAESGDAAALPAAGDWVAVRPRPRGSARTYDGNTENFGDPPVHHTH